MILKQLFWRATFKLLLVHVAALLLVISPLYSIQPNDYMLPLVINCLLATLNLLMLNCPLFATVTMIIALNLELTCTLPLLPLFLAYAIANIVVNSPSAYLVKQVDYIVWKVIFLLITIVLTNAVIWWS